ncbi:unnamed protein product [Vitrella brassicaformis CCMP3155]|uniref:Uncharacterized protein n=1 Tax=Vitrella brassicaformis (strain CCMP3155) TaxID=1169540 RepID=A0A0G4GTX3_VITBC|nr:unnamed protein product [Vitrella brassicaformis CCMP3155]|eukprot:CEM34210.1 unnamed protein product [Vitrella brassicaformis CCMP3155]
MRRTRSESRPPDGGGQLMSHSGWVRQMAEKLNALTENDTATVDDIREWLRKNQRLESADIAFQNFPDVEGGQLARHVFKDGDVIIYTAGDGHHVVDMERGGGGLGMGPANRTGEAESQGGTDSQGDIRDRVTRQKTGLALFEKYFKPVYRCCLCCEGAMVMAKWLCQACAPAAAAALNQTISNLCGHRHQQTNTMAGQGATGNQGAPGRRVTCILMVVGLVEVWLLYNSWTTQPAQGSSNNSAPHTHTGTSQSTHLPPAT